MEMKDYILEIYKVEADKYSKTREIHWKVNIAIWSVLIVAIYAKATAGFAIPGKFQIIVYFVYCLVHGIFIIKIHGSINRSLQRMYNMAKYILEENSKEVKWKDFEKKTIPKQYYWELLQIVVTVFLIGIFQFLLI